MHLEILVEGQAERTALEPILAKLLGPYDHPHTWKIHKHRGVGELPANLNDQPNPRNPTLLHNLPALLRGFGKGLTDDQAVVVLLDLDDKDCMLLKQQLVEILDTCEPVPRVLFRIAIESLEAWFLGDQTAFLKAYPNANMSILSTYQQDAICGTWKLIADAVYHGGSKALKAKGRLFVLEEKRVWAKNIAPLMAIESNASTSFCVFRDGIRRLVQRQ